MTTAYATAHTRFKLGSHKAFDVSLLLAAAFHLLAFALFPGYAPESLVIEPEKPVVLFEVADEVEVPLPPLPVERPSLPMDAELSEVIVSDQVDPEETIIDTEVDIDNPAPGRFEYEGVAGRDEPYQQYSTPPMEKKLYVPEYPSLARQAGIEGTVVARVTIDERGRVIDVVIVDSPGEIFHQPVVDALMKSEFYPAMQREIPVRSRVIVPFDFYLR